MQVKSVKVNVPCNVSLVDTQWRPEPGCWLVTVEVCPDVWRDGTRITVAVVNREPLTRQELFDSVLKLLKNE